MKTIVEFFTHSIRLIGDVCSLLILVVMGIITYEVVARYGFNSPTSWAWLINKQLFGVFVMIAGSYALVHGSHIRIEMAYQHFPKTIKKLIGLFTFLCACCFLGALVWKSAVMGEQAWANKELAVGVFKLPLYPLKLFMPVTALIFLLGCVLELVRKR
ncbi:MAG: TRAP transporter small permease subunit [Desulfopila sp.]